ncbi:hypothetical protein OB13_15955 [Pontibacter sp. HJ8]
MLRKYKTVFVTASMSAIMLLGIFSAPHAAELQNGCATAHTAASPANTPSTAATTNGPATAAPQKQHKSVLDAEALESPLSYFKDAASSEEEETEMAVRSGVIMQALKALVATLLSTII